jgi:hypothetical protein
MFSKKYRIKAASTVAKAWMPKVLLKTSILRPKKSPINNTNSRDTLQGKVIRKMM